MLHLDKLSDEALGNSDSFCSEMMPHQVSHRSDSTGGNGYLEEQNHNMNSLTGYPAVTSAIRHILKSFF